MDNITLVSLCIEGVDLNIFSSITLSRSARVSLCIEGVDLNFESPAPHTPYLPVSLCIEGVDLNSVLASVFRMENESPSA